jgi:hypothetical protein
VEKKTVTNNIKLSEAVCPYYHGCGEKCENGGYLLLNAETAVLPLSSPLTSPSVP